MYVQIFNPWGHVYMEANGAGQAVVQMEVTWGVDLDYYLKKPPRKYFELNVTETYPFYRNKTIIETTFCTKYV